MKKITLTVPLKRIKLRTPVMKTVRMADQTKKIVREDKHKKEPGTE